MKLPIGGHGLGNTCVARQIDTLWSSHDEIRDRSLLSVVLGDAGLFNLPSRAEVPWSSPGVLHAYGKAPTIIVMLFMANFACTGIMLNWKRPQNVYQIIEGWRSSGLSEGIVWNNNAEITLPHHSWAKVINASVDLGLYTRFAAACLSQNDCILIQDDDILLPQESIRQLFTYWQCDPDVLHGIFWRKPKPCGSYAIFGKGNGEAPIVLTRALMAHRRHAANFFIHLPHFEEIQINSQPFGNGEDIIFSYVARLGAAGRLHKTYDLPVIELPAPYGIHHNNPQQHLAHRSNLLRACEEWFRKMTARVEYYPGAR